MEDFIVSLFWDFLRQQSFALDVVKLSLDQLKQVLSGQVVGQARAERIGDVIHATSSARRPSTWKGWWPTFRRDPRGYANSLQNSVAGDDVQIASGGGEAQLTLHKDTDAPGEGLQSAIDVSHVDDGKWKPSFNLNDQTGSPDTVLVSLGRRSNRTKKKGAAQRY